MSHFVFLSQVYPPDPAAVGQHFEDVAVRLAERGHRITVYASSRDYDCPEIRYDNYSRHPNVRVVRLPFSSFGKRTILHRLFGQASYILQIFGLLLFKRGIDGLLLTTVPISTGILFLALRAFRRYNTLYWIMDLNPEQAVAQGIAKDSDLSVRFLRACNKSLIEKATKVVVLDSYMKRRLEKNISEGTLQNIHIIPPWPLERNIHPIDREENRFLASHGLQEQSCIFMYSGNHSLVHPLDTLIKAIKVHQNEGNLAFLFIGGGRGKKEIDEFINQYSPANVRSLPYQPLSKLGESLSAADVHLVVMGEKMVGIVHPCKIYGAMAAAKPILFIGPRDSHLGELVSRNNIGWIVDHGDVQGLSTLISEISSMPNERLISMGKISRRVLSESYSSENLAEEFCDLIEDLNR